jgi:hypothetical protein
MTKYHINSMGKALKCSAEKGRCPFGGADDHYDSVQQAQNAYESHMSHELNKILGGAQKQSMNHAIEYPAGHIDSKNQEDLIRKCIIEKRTMSQLERARHSIYVAEVIDLLEKKGYTTEMTHTVETMGGLEYTKERQEFHTKIVDEYMDKIKGVPKKREAIFAGGLGGAGKSTVLDGHARINQSKYATINPDDIKEIMAEKGLIPKVEGLTPMEASPLIHEEASHITGVILEKLRAEGTNIIFDITMSSHGSIKKRIDMLRESKYEKIEAIFVDIKPETSSERGNFRYNQGLDQYLTNGVGHGGRPLPARLTEGQKPQDPERFNSKNAEVLVELDNSDLFTSTPRVFDNDTFGRDPIEISFKSFSKKSTYSEL